MCTPAAVSQVFCNTAHGCGLGSLRSFLWWSWGSEMLSLLCYQCSRSMWVCCLCGHQGTWQKWKFWDSAVEVMLCLYWSSFPCEVLPFSVCLYALTLLVGHQEQHLACKNLVMRCWCGYLSGASCRLFAYVPADATATPKPYRLASFKSTYLLCATSEQHVRRSILRGGWAACMEWAAVQSTRHCSIVSCLQRTFKDTFIFYLVWGHGAFVTFMIYLRRV